MSAGITKRSVMIAEGRGQSVQALVGAIDAGRGAQNLSSAIRVFVLDAVRGRAIPQT